MPGKFCFSASATKVLPRYKLKQVSPLWRNLLEFATVQMAEMFGRSGQTFLPFANNLQYKKRDRSLSWGKHDR
jgi:hypothetical protein